MFYLIFLFYIYYLDKFISYTYLELLLFSKLFSRIKKIYKQLEEKSDILTTNTEILTANVTFENLLENIKEINEGKKIDDIWFDIYNFYKNKSCAVFRCLWI